MLCEVHTPLDIAEWRSQLCWHPDREFCQYLIDGLTDGFRIGFNYTSHRCQAAKRNMLSAVQNPGVVEQYLKNVNWAAWLGHWRQAPYPCTLIDLVSYRSLTSPASGG